MKFHLKKIISGGQTGVDLGALEAAMSAGLQWGGWCPPDCRNEDETEAPGVQQLTYDFVIRLWQQLVKLHIE